MTVSYTHLDVYKRQAQNLIIEQTSLDSFIAGFELAWRLSIELQNDENERSFSYRTRRTGARCVWEDEI